MHQSSGVLLNSKVNLCLLEVSKLLGAYFPLGNKWALQTKLIGKLRNFENAEEILAFQ